MTTTSLMVRPKNIPQKDFKADVIDAYYVEGERKEFKSTFRSKKRIPHELWDEMFKKGWTADECASLNYVINAKDAEYVHVKNKTHGYVEGIQLSEVQFVHQNGKTFDLGWGHDGVALRERRIILGVDEKPILIHVIENPTLTDMSMPNFFHPVQPMNLIPDSKAPPVIKEYLLRNGKEQHQIPTTEEKAVSNETPKQITNGAEKNPINEQLRLSWSKWLWNNFENISNEEKAKVQKVINSTVQGGVKETEKYLWKWHEWACSIG